LPDRESPVLTRELIYTGLTRVRRRVELWARLPIFEQGIARVTRCASALSERLL